ncbi:MAG: SH3 domain-containing protein [Chrysiogenales bacterium]|nr:MAG: SH3 domain-containing protein [Chrysiogenales bacterium]
MQNIYIKTYVIILLCTISITCSEKSNKSPDVAIPVISKGCLSGQCVAGQFETAYQCFALISGDGVNLRSKPDIASRIITQLPATRKVTVLYVEQEEKTIGGMSGRWAFIRDSTKISREGWGFDQLLAYLSNFHRPKMWKPREIRVILGGNLMVYFCSSNGKFQSRPQKKGAKNIDTVNPELITGEILECKNIIWLRKDSPDDYPIFFRRLDNGNLDLSDHYRNTRGVVITK